MLQKYTKNNPIWLKFHLKSFQTSTSQRKFRKSHFFGMTPFRGTPISEKMKIANRFAKIFIKLYPKHYFLISYGITHSIYRILLPKSILVSQVVSILFYGPCFKSTQPRIKLSRTTQSE